MPEAFGKVDIGYAGSNMQLDRRWRKRGYPSVNGVP